MPSAIGRVLGVVRRLIDFGRELAGKLQQRTAAPDFTRVAMRFGTADVAAILARITAGLRRAALLEAALCRRAAHGMDLAPAPIRLPAARAQPSERQAALLEPQAAAPAQDPRLARLPTEEEIAAQVRRRPVGAVIADICRDLSIMPGQFDRRFWDELRHAIMTYGGSLTCFLPDVNRRLSDFCSLDDVGPERPAAPPRSPQPATGPP